MRTTSASATLFAAALCYCALAMGCDKSYELAEVTGKVTTAGQPVSAGTVVFIPDQGVAASGAIQTDGSYRLSTPGHGDGAIIGHHKICILPRNPLERVSTLPTGPIDGPNLGDPIDELAPPAIEPTIPPRYQIAKTSNFMTDVVAGKNVVNLPLFESP